MQYSSMLKLEINNKQSWKNHTDKFSQKMVSLPYGLRSYSTKRIDNTSTYYAFIEFY